MAYYFLEFKHLTAKYMKLFFLDSRTLERPLLTHQFSNGGRYKTQTTYVTEIPPPSFEWTILTRQLLLFTFAPKDRTEWASTLVPFMFFPLVKLNGRTSSVLYCTYFCYSLPMYRKSIESIELLEPILWRIIGPGHGQLIGQGPITWIMAV